MIKIQFTPKEELSKYLDYNDIEIKKWYEPQFNTLIKDSTIQYPDSAINNYFYKILNEQADYCGLFDPLDFFNILYEQFEIVLTNIKIPLKVRDHLSELKIGEHWDQRKHYFLLDSLYYLICQLNEDPYVDLEDENSKNLISNTIKPKSPALALIGTYLSIKLAKIRQEFSKRSVFEKIPYCFMVPIFNSHPLKSNEPGNSPKGKTTSIGPKFKSDFTSIIFDNLKDFFSIQDQDTLKKILENGSIAPEKLIFLDNGNRLTDAFKKLSENDFIPGCQKKDLNAWIVKNFLFTYRNKTKAFTEDYVKKVISRKNYPCKSPLIKIEENKINKASLPKTRKS